MQTVVDVPMFWQSFEAAERDIEVNKTVLFGLWPSTPRGRIHITVGDNVLIRLSAVQERGVPGRVVALRAGSYTVRCLNGTFEDVLEGRLERVVFRKGDKVSCAHGTGELLAIDKDTCRVAVKGTEHIVDRLAVLPCNEIDSGYANNATVRLMERTCGETMVHCDILPGEVRVTVSVCVTSQSASDSFEDF